MGNVTIFAPDGRMGEIPEEQLAAAVKAGAQPGVHIIAPNGKTGIVPANRYVDAAKAGAKVQPFEEQEVKHPGFWASLGDDLWDMAKNAPKALLSAGVEAAGADPEAMRQAGLAPVEDTAGTIIQHARGRNNQPQYPGRTLEHIAAPLGEAVGVNVPGMEQSAAEGDTAGVMGHAVSVPVAIALTKGAARAGSELAAALTLEDLGKITPKQVAQGTGATAGGISGHGTLSAPGAYYGGKFGGKVAEGILGKEAVNTSISDLINDWRISTGTKPGAYNPGAPLPEAPSTELQQSSALAKPGATPPESPDAALGRLPVAQPEAPQPSPTPLSKAQLSKQLETELNKATGGKPLQPGVPLRNQWTGNASETPSATEGFTPVKSSAVQAYKYDPDAHELSVQTPGGGTHIYGEVTPDQASDFAAGKYIGQGADDPPSIGKAWKDIRDSSPPVGKIVNGTRVAVKPPANLQSAAPESSIGDDLMELLNKSLENAKGAKGAAEAPKGVSSSPASVPPEPANGRTGPSAALYEPRQPEFPVASGAHTEVSVPGSNNSYPAQYEVRELADLHPYDQAA